MYYCPHCEREISGKINISRHKESCIFPFMDEIKAKMLELSTNGEMPLKHEWDKERGDLPKAASITHKKGWQELADELNLSVPGGHHKPTPLSEIIIITVKEDALRSGLPVIEKKWQKRVWIKHGVPRIEYYKTIR